MEGNNEGKRNYNFDPITGERINPAASEAGSESAADTNTGASDPNTTVTSESSQSQAEDFFRTEEDTVRSETENTVRSEMESTFRSETPSEEPRAEYQQYKYSTDTADTTSNTTSDHSSKNTKKPMSLGKKFAIAIAFAAVIGLVGGIVFYGVNYIGNRYISYNQSLSDSRSSASIEDKKDSTKEETKKEEAKQKVQQQEAQQKEEIQAVPETEAVPEENSIPGKPEMSESSDQIQKTATIAAGTVAEVAANCVPSVVTIASIGVVEMQNFFGQTQQYEAEGAGSGVIVGMNDTELLIATNNHVVKGAKELSVGFVDETSAQAFVKGTDSDNDLAVIAVKLEEVSDDTRSRINVATIGNSEELLLGEQVVAIGNALGNGTSVTSGYVSAMNRDMTFSDGSYTINQTKLIQTDAPINSGNSGGGLFNLRGELVGINEAKSSMSSSGATVDGVGYAISIDKAKPILENLMSLETKEPISQEEQGYLGVTCADVTSDIATMYDMPEGVCFTTVLEGSPAAEAGVQKGDVLKKFAGTEISSYEELKEELSYHKAGETVEMTVMRFANGEYEEMTIDITLGSYEVIKELSMNE